VASNAAPLEIRRESQIEALEAEAAEEHQELMSAPKTNHGGALPV
jgi:hypothetical protein